jgi:hypothetical protein
MIKSIITAAVVAIITTTSSYAADQHCQRMRAEREQSSDTGNSLMTSPIPKECMTEGEKRTKAVCETIPAGTRGRMCWAYGLE